MAKRDRTDAVAADVQTTPDLDLEHVRGQEGAKRALEIAAAGAHPILLAGPQSSGKTMLARALPGILPPLSEEETAEIAEVYRRANLEPTAGAPGPSGKATTDGRSKVPARLGALYAWNRSGRRWALGRGAAPCLLAQSHDRVNR